VNDVPQGIEVWVEDDNGRYFSVLVIARHEQEALTRVRYILAPDVAHIVSVVELQK
jgi:hypothetical protein